MRGVAAYLRMRGIAAYLRMRGIGAFNTTWYDYVFTWGLMTFTAKETDIYFQEDGELVVLGYAQVVPDKFIAPARLHTSNNPHGFPILLHSSINRLM